MAVYNAHLRSGCMEGTRTQLLRDIETWLNDPKAPPIYWLAGMAGTGKTAIAWTVCRRADGNHNIIFGGSFFCSRSTGLAAQRDVRCIVPTLAQLLARQSSTFAKALSEELARDPDVLQKQVGAQVEQLLYKPLIALEHSDAPIIFFIDALDECGGQQTGNEAFDDAESHRIVSDMLEALIDFSCFPVKLPVKFFLTSRPETHIRDTPVADDRFSIVMRLHTVNKDQVAADIRLYIDRTLSKNPRLKTRISSGDSEQLVQLCDGLFIVAATALQHILGAGVDSAAVKFRTLLNAARDGLNAGVAAPIDSMYALILMEAARFDEDEADALSGLLQLLASLLSARMALSVETLADLLITQVEDLRALLSRLHAVIHIPDDDYERGLRIVHASFGDYLFTRAPIHIRLSRTLGQENLVRGCLHVMRERLYFNISQSKSSFVSNSAIRPACITFSLEYACTQWTYHLSALPGTLISDQDIGDIFCSRVLFWLEVMSVMGQVWRAAAMLFVAAAKVY